MMSKRALLRLAGLSTISLLLCGVVFADDPLELVRGKVIAHYTFEPGEEVKWGGMGKHKGWYSVITTDPAEVISGKGSLKCDTRESSKDTRHSVFFTIPENLPLRRNHPYFISFKYRVLDMKNVVNSHAFLRFPQSELRAGYKGMVRIAQKPGLYETRMFELVGNRDDYQVNIEIRGRGAMVVDDFVVWEEEIDPATLQPPSPVYPRDGALLSPEALQFVWTVSPPAIEYEVQLSPTSDFSRPISFSMKVPIGLQFCIHTFRHRGKEFRANLAHRVTWFAPRNLGDGQWYWRVSPKGGRWSEARKFTLKERLEQKPSVVNISPRSPLVILCWHHDPPAGRISACWRTVP